MNRVLAVDDIQFEILIQPFDGVRIVEPFMADRDRKILEIAKLLHVPTSGDWYVEADPPAYGRIPIPVSLAKIRKKGHPETVADLGLIAGATLHFFQVPDELVGKQGSGRRRGAKKKSSGKKS